MPENNLHGPIVTLFALTSVDGKICTGPSDYFDFDIDLSKVSGVNNGLQQYYDIEKQTDVWALTTGVTQAKMHRLKGDDHMRIPVNLVVVDSNHLTREDRDWLNQRYERVIFAIPNQAYCRDLSQEVLCYGSSLQNLMEILRSKYGCTSITAGVGGTMAWSLLQEGCVDYVRLVMAPIIVGGKGTPSLVDGAGLTSVSDLSRLTTLVLQKVVTLDYGYLDLHYSVSPESKIANARQIERFPLELDTAFSEGSNKERQYKPTADGTKYRVVFECDNEDTASYLETSINSEQLYKFTPAYLLGCSKVGRFVTVFLQTDDSGKLYWGLFKFAVLTKNKVAFVGFEESRVGEATLPLAKLQNPVMKNVRTETDELMLEDFIRQFIQGVQSYRWSVEDIESIVTMCCLGRPSSTTHSVCKSLITEWCTISLPDAKTIRAHILSAYRQDDAVGNIYVRVMAHLIYLSLLYSGSLNFISKAAKKVNSALKKLNLGQ